MLASEELMRNARDANKIIPSFNISYLPMVEPIVAALRDANSFGQIAISQVDDEDNPRCSVATDIATFAATQAMEYLRAPVKLVTAPHTPVPFSSVLEETYIPNKHQVAQAAREIASS